MSRASLPTWERGLKSITAGLIPIIRTVAPYMGAWIEITLPHGFTKMKRKVAPYMGAWIEIYPHLLRGFEDS